VLACTIAQAVAYIDGVTELHVELPPAVEVHHGASLDQQALRRLESSE
jgi:hypothetical protein